MINCWVDRICFESVIALFSIMRRRTVGKIYYINRSKYSLGWQLLKTFSCVPVTQVTDVVGSDEQVDGMSLFEYVQGQWKSRLDEWAAQQEMDGHVRHVCAARGFNPLRYTEFLKQEARIFFYRPVEMMALAEKIYGQSDAVYLWRRTPFCGDLERMAGAGKTEFYTTWFSHWFAVEERPGYYYDLATRPAYGLDRFQAVVNVLVRWAADAVCGVLSGLVRNPAQHRWKIALELTQSRIRLDEMNDIAWLNGSDVSLKDVCGIEPENFDELSLRILDEQGISRVRIRRNPLVLVRQIMSRIKTPFVSCSPDAGYGMKTLPVLARLVPALILWDQKRWLMLASADYICRTQAWRSIYSQLGVNLVWTMNYGDYDKIPKAQVLEELGALYVGGHWSNMPLYQLDNQKYYDVLLTWGEFFIKNHFVHQRYLSVFALGYPADYYFGERRERALQLRNQFPGKFILSYHDNNIWKDSHYSKNMQTGIHQMIVDLLQEHANLVVFLKPKRKHAFEVFHKDFPALDRFIKEGRLEVFVGDTPRTKAVAAEIGMASDLVIGLGISSAAGECFFAGTVSFHADLTRFERNQFGNEGLGKVVFRDIVSLRETVERQITGQHALTHADCRKYYDMLDPFQDGRSHIRMGFIVKRLSEKLAQGFSREEAVGAVKEEYARYLKNSEPVDALIR